MTPRQESKTATRATNRVPDRVKEYQKADNDEDALTVWLFPTPANIAWLDNELAISRMPGHSKRKIIKEKVDGVLTGRLALARVEG
jgi:hypothetical protein